VRVRPLDPRKPELVYDLKDINDYRRALIAPPLQSGDMLVVDSVPTSVNLHHGPPQRPRSDPRSAGVQRTAQPGRGRVGGLRDFLDPQEATLWRFLRTATRCA